MMNLPWLASWLAVCIAFAGAWYYPFPFSQGVNAASVNVSGGNIYHMDLGLIAGSVDRIVVGENQTITGLQFYGDDAPTMFMIDQAVEFCDATCTWCETIVVPQYHAQYTADYRKIALTAMWSLNSAYAGMGVSEVDERAPFVAVLRVRTGYTDLVSNIIRMYTPQYPIYSVVSAPGTWSFMRKEQKCMHGWTNAD